jgi:Tfp pilus assembly protein PilN
MRAVNLLPRDEQQARFEGKRTPLLVLAGGVAAVTAAAVMLGLSASGAADDKRAQLQSVEAAIARLPRAPKPAVSQGTLTQERTDRIAALSAALSTRISFDRLLRQIALVLPEDAWLTGLRVVSPGSLTSVTPTPSSPTPATTTEDVTIEGATYSHPSVARVLSRLSVVPTLQNVRLTASALVEQQAAGPATPGEKPATQKKGKPVVTFTVTASLRTGASS